jgi:hypothetical protein
MDVAQLGLRGWMPSAAYGPVALSANAEPAGKDSGVRYAISPGPIVLAVDCGVRNIALQGLAGSTVGAL